MMKAATRCLLPVLISYAISLSPRTALEPDMLKKKTFFLHSGSAYGIPCWIAGMPGNG